MLAGNKIDWNDGDSWTRLQNVPWRRWIEMVGAAAAADHLIWFVKAPANVTCQNT